MNIPGINNASHTTVVNNVKTAVAVNQLQQSTAAALQALANPQPTQHDINQLTEAFDRFIKGDVQMLINIGDSARNNPDSIPRISQAYNDVFDEKHHDLLGDLPLARVSVDGFLVRIAEANNGSPDAKANLETLSLQINWLAGNPNIPTPQPGVDPTEIL